MAAAEWALAIVCLAFSSTGGAVNVRKIAAGANGDVGSLLISFVSCISRLPFCPPWPADMSLCWWRWRWRWRTNNDEADDEADGGEDKEDENADVDDDDDDDDEDEDDVGDA